VQSETHLHEGFVEKLRGQKQDQKSPETKILETHQLPVQIDRGSGRAVFCTKERSPIVFTLTIPLFTPKAVMAFRRPP
jgi:hypothetical protein